MEEDGRNIISESLSYPGRSKKGREIFLRGALDIPCGMHHRNSGHDRFRQQILRAMHLQQDLFLLPTLHRRLLLILVIRQFLIEETGTLTTTYRVQPVHT